MITPLHPAATRLADALDLHDRCQGILRGELLNAEGAISVMKRSGALFGMLPLTDDQRLAINAFRRPQDAHAARSDKQFLHSRPPCRIGRINDFVVIVHEVSRTDAPDQKSPDQGSITPLFKDLIQSGGSGTDILESVKALSADNLHNLDKASVPIGDPIKPWLDRSAVDAPGSMKKHIGPEELREQQAANAKARTTVIAAAPTLLGAIESIVIVCAKELKAAGLASEAFSMNYQYGGLKDNRALRAVFLQYGEPDVDHVPSVGGISARQRAEKLGDEDVTAIPLSPAALRAAEVAEGRARVAAAQDRRARYGFD
jgi:hypothetical protein